MHCLKTIKKLSTMAKYFLLCLFLTSAFVFLARADTPITSANSPAASSLPSFRKLGKHHQKLVKFSTSGAPAPGLSPHQEEEKKAKEVGSSNEHNGIEKKHHHSIDKSICGVGVILGG
ncbi:hypothetical protein CQW23_23969 [Capsicum baccatum]|uniref:Uncharacterized protein n=1 Tax=Capsicum baccatum TaxID=33114 RepID=A0A2G2VTE8_CAPBA|nr:hypothetical protein CQW23_23969 [Capsicum baccatum]